MDRLFCLSEPSRRGSALARSWSEREVQSPCRGSCNGARNVPRSSVASPRPVLSRCMLFSSVSAVTLPWNVIQECSARYASPWSSCVSYRPGGAFCLLSCARVAIPRAQGSCLGLALCGRPAQSAQRVEQQGPT